MHPVLFELGGMRVYSYGALIALGGLVSGLIWNAKRKAMGLRRDEDFWLLINAILFGGFLGGRILFILEYVPLRGPQLWPAIFSFNKGFSVLGAFVGVAAGIWIVARHLRLEFLRVLDYVSLLAPLWHVFGRLGCFAAGCCFGSQSDAPWAVRFTDPLCMVSSRLLGAALHPAQLYEAAGDMAVFAGLFFMVLPRLERGSMPAGVLSGVYFTAYGVLRFFMEFYRGDTVPAAFGLTAGQGLSFCLVACGLALVFWRRRKPCTLS